MTSVMMPCAGCSSRSETPAQPFNPISLASAASLLADGALPSGRLIRLAQRGRRDHRRARRRALASSTSTHQRCRAPAGVGSRSTSATGPGWATQPWSGVTRRSRAPVRGRYVGRWWRWLRFALVLQGARTRWREVRGVTSLEAIACVFVTGSDCGHGVGAVRLSRACQ